MREPLFETPARLDWRLRHGELIFYPDTPSVTFALTPVFIGCSEKLAELGIAWNLWALLDSVRRPGAYFLLNCECGIPSDAGLEEPISVSHPDDETVVWEIDIRGSAPALEDWIAWQEGFIRLVFARADYEAGVRAMLREVQRVYREPVPVASLTGLHGSSGLDQAYPGISHAVADIFEPGMHGNCDVEEFAAMDADVARPREPLLPPGTVLEIGFFGSELYRVDGQTRYDWLGRWFTRYAVADAFRVWLDPVLRKFALPFVIKDAVPHLPEEVRTSDFVLLPDRDLASCHRAGEHFAETLQRSFREGLTAPGVTVRYVRNDPPQPVCTREAAS
jgi:hypothetical protein